MTMQETIDFILKNKESLNPAVLKAVLGEISDGSDEETPEDPAVNPPEEDTTVEPEEPEEKEEE